ncbi:amidohydrolase family protein [Arthrobacter sp. YN]|uniref:amidohydrolase family protein n=1 Tax=Arthrobacter sp. YN TaxID=2020486 RepID=UPI000B618A9A|nr:amidohydrolase family protein [Arthrobacter sp. YN]ASN20081.1 dihydropyrimidinase [Arthrobacter sp. YN]
MSEPIGGREPYDLVITGGRVVNAAGSRSGTVLVRDGRITEILDPGAPVPPHQRAIDASDQLVIPGGVDPHCHVGQVLGEFSMLDNHAEASIAALWGGTTTIIDFAIPEPGQSPLQAVHEKRKSAQDTRTDLALHGGVVAWDGTTHDQLLALADLGVLTVKMFTTYRDGVMAGFDTIEKVMRVMADVGGVAIIHAEENHLVEQAQSREAASGRGDSRHHGLTRPESAEAAAVSRTLELAAKTGSAVYFVHQTTPEVVDLVRAANAKGVRAFSETCPHYITLNESVYESATPELFVCCPPLRSKVAMTGLRDRALQGHIHTLGSDHCCYSREQKAKYRQDVRSMPNGLPGVEHRLSVSFDTLVVRGGMSLENFVAMFSTNPAILNGLRTKGWLGAGADADIVVLDPKKRLTVNAGNHHMKTDYSPYEGIEFTGAATTVISGGRVVIDERGFHDPGPVGRHLFAKAQLDGVPLLAAPHVGGTQTVLNAIDRLEQMA